ncbi:MAG: GIN domain-containing protein [Sphingomicrobium sp.]|nr:DUF2807 domain-containing protein [Sphingomonadales bacterium]
MRITLLAGFAGSFALSLASPAAADSRNFSVVSFDRVRIDGPYRVTLATGVAPFASATGSPQALDGVAIDVQGRTLIVHANPSSWGGYPGAGRGPVEISIGTHELNAAWVNGSGSLAIDGVKGLSFDLSVQGAGSASIGQVDVDQFRLGLAGAASAKLVGRAPRLTAIVRGTSALDGSDLAVKDATVGADGPAIVKLAVSNSIKVDAMGTATVSLAGSPACTIKTTGSASVEGCR